MVVTNALQSIKVCVLHSMLGLKVNCYSVSMNERVRVFIAMIVGCC